MSGYPPDLLDIDLEADLGIDTVKEAEVFAASDAYNIEGDDAFNPGRLPHIGKMALPTHVDRVTRFADAEYPGPLWAVVTPPGPARRWSTRRGACGLGATARSICAVAWTRGRSRRSARR